MLMSVEGDWVLVAGFQARVCSRNKIQSNREHIETFRELYHSRQRRRLLINAVFINKPIFQWQLPQLMSNKLMTEWLDLLDHHPNGKRLLRQLGCDRSPSGVSCCHWEFNSLRHTNRFDVFSVRI